jgi:glyoxylase-like metal-dependent hydrolase (beta-lactamase superfamily II)
MSRAAGVDDQFPDFRDDFERLGLQVLERGWLSSNNVVFAPRHGDGATVVDTGYATHADQTVDLIRRALSGAPLARVLNTHLHSDHCGGNAALSSAYGAEVLVPSASLEAVREWDESRLSFARTDQRCDRFQATAGVRAGDTVLLGGRHWLAVAGGGHDPDALMYLEPDARVLISGDMLWEDRLAIVFPELEGRAGFGDVSRSLDVVERLRPRIVVPGHGRAFSNVSSALDRSRRRLEGFLSRPREHFAYAVRALAMFRMLEHRRLRREALSAWIGCSEILVSGAIACGYDGPLHQLAREAIDRLVAGGQLVAQGDELRVA